MGNLIQEYLQRNGGEEKRPSYFSVDLFESLPFRWQMLEPNVVESLKIQSLAKAIPTSLRQPWRQNVE